MQKVAVTGASGFIGQNLCALLKGRGHSVLELDLPGNDVTDTGKLTELLANFSPVALYHLAGQASVPRSWENPLETFRVNSGGTASMLEAVRRSGIRMRVLVVSSASVYDGSALRSPADESMPPDPSSPYGSSKLIAEQVTHAYVSQYGLDATIVRPFNVIGRGQSPEYVVPAIARRVLLACSRNEGFIEIGSVSSVRDFVDVRDAVRAMESALTTGASGKVYNICSGVGTSILDIASRLVALTGVAITLRPVGSLQRMHDRSYNVGNPSLAHWELGWERRVTLDESLSNVLEEWKGRTAPSEG